MKISNFDPSQKLIVFKFINNLNQNLYEIKFEVSQYDENENSPEIESFIRYYENKGFKISTDYNDIHEVVIFEISW